MENRSERFKRIATKRTVDIIDKIRILGNTSNKSTYEYTEADVAKIFKTIESELKKQKSKFTTKKTEFSL
ncbi:MAG: hypothetical protein HN564_04535 [Flavobacteriales bacterium]|jgi:hypothetical protein|nr:hypothetical protein [Flavobacteriales bacterium]